LPAIGTAAHLGKHAAQAGSQLGDSNPGPSDYKSAQNRPKPLFSKVFHGPALRSTSFNVTTAVTLLSWASVTAIVTARARAEILSVVGFAGLLMQCAADRLPSAPVLPDVTRTVTLLNPCRSPRTL